MTADEAVLLSIAEQFIGAPPKVLRDASALLILVRLFHLAKDTAAVPEAIALLSQRQKRFINDELVARLEDDLKTVSVVALMKVES